MLKSWQVNKQSCKVLMTKSQNQSHNHRHKLNRIRAYLTTGSTKNLVETRLFRKKWKKSSIPMLTSIHQDLIPTNSYAFWVGLMPVDSRH